MRRRSLLLIGIAAGALSAVATLAFGSHHLLVAKLAASRSPIHGSRPSRCAPRTLNRSAVLPGTKLAVSPLPGSYAASARTQISLLGAPVHSIAGLRVSGSRTGAHRGRLRGYSQGDGASFLPSSSFAAGETVTVRGRVRTGRRAQRFAYSFTVAQPDVLPYSAPRVPSGRHAAQQMQHFRSRPDLQPPVLVVSARSPQTAPGYIFASPYAGPGKPGPEIFDEAGNLVWFHPMPQGVEAANLQLQRLGGKTVLAWWQGYIPHQGFGQGEVVLADSSYRQIGRVHAGNGYKVDLHDFQITPRGTALLSVFDPLSCDLSSRGGPTNGAVSDSGFQEVDLRTGLVRREWHGIDHVSLGDSYSRARGTSRTWPLDFFHFNSIDQLDNGTTLISARNTWAMYELNTATGQIRKQLGGKRSGVTLSRGAATAYQHDATVLANGTISLFDNGATPKVHRQSRGLIVSVSGAARTEAVVTQFLHPRHLLAASQGNLQPLENGDVFIGWGSEPFFSEFSSSGQLLFDAHWHGSYQSYRAYRFQWAGAPSEPPAVAAQRQPSGGATVFASWNGDTRTAAWKVLAGPSAQQLAPVAYGAKTGFETALAAPAPAAYVAVQALDASGAVLGTSRALAVR
jgi:hypothetical protein